MTDADLLRHYLERGGEPWNVSAESAYFEFRVRDFLERHATRRLPMHVANLGVGAGVWDDFLGHWIGDDGLLVSVDADPAIAALFRYRQAREQHPFPSEVVCADALGDALAAASFDLVTVVGSTPGESGDPHGLVRRAFELVRPGGQLLLASLEEDVPLGALERWLEELEVEDLVVDEDARFPGLPFHLVIALRGMTRA